MAYRQFLASVIADLLSNQISSMKLLLRDGWLSIRNVRGPLVVTPYFAAPNERCRRRPEVDDDRDID
jgi:hypothetical protein